MAEMSMDLVIRGKYDGAGLRGGLSSLNRDLEQLQRREFDSGHDTRERALRDIDDYYGKIRARAQRSADLLRGAETDLLTKQFNASMGGKDTSTLDRQMSGVKAQQTRLADVMAQAERSEQTERATAKTKWAEEDAAAEAARAGRREADADSLNRRLFDATHNARERELAASSRYFNDLRAQYAGNAEMLKRIKETEGAEINAINERYQQQGLKKLLSPRGLRGLLGGYALAVGTQEVFNIAGAFAESSRASAIAANPSARLTDVVGSELAARQAASNAWGGIPIFGGAIKNIYEGATNQKGLEELQRSAADASQRLTQLGQATGQAVAKLQSLEASVRGYTGEETPFRRLEQGNLERMAQVHAGWEAIQAAQTALAQAMVSGVGVAQAQKLADAATGRFIALQGTTGQQAKMESEFAWRSATLDQIQFLRAMEERRGAATYQRLPQTMQSRQALDVAGMNRRQAAEMEQFAGLEGRQQALANAPQWMTDWIERTISERMAANPSQNEVDLRKSVAGESGGAYNRETEFASRQQQRRDEVAKTQQQERDGMAVTHAIEKEDIRSNFALRAQLAGVAGPSLAESEERARLQFKTQQEEELKHFAEGTVEYKQAKKTQEGETLVQERAFYRARSDLARQWNQERLLAELEGDQTIQGARKREQVQLDEQIRREKELYGESVEIREKWTAQQKALDDKYVRLQLTALRATPHEVQSQSSRFLSRLPGYEDPAIITNRLLQQIADHLTKTPGLTLIPVKIGR